MILIRRGKEPESLLEYRKSSPEACYENLPTKPREDIRKQMWAEQKGLCAYCMCKINTPKDFRIEHYVARNPEDGDYDAASTLDFKNMLGVCYGNSLWPGLREADKTCDAHRKNKPLTVNPYDITSVRKIRYTTEGYITSDDDNIKTDVNDTLNLNCESRSLPENRKAVLLQVKKEIGILCRNKSHRFYLEVLEKYYNRYTEQGALIPYCGIVIAWLEKELNVCQVYR